jgi:hypothetical protein
MHPIPFRMTEQQAAWINAQASCGSLSRSAVVRLCVQRAMESPAPLLGRAPEPEHASPEQL